MSTCVSSTHVLKLSCDAALELDGSEVNRGNFPLPNLGPKLEKLGSDIYNGRGFCLVRGLDVSKYSVEDLTMIWLGMQSYIAEQQGRQDKNGNMLSLSAKNFPFKQETARLGGAGFAGSVGPAANTSHFCSPHLRRQVNRHIG